MKNNYDVNYFDVCGKKTTTITAVRIDTLKVSTSDIKTGWFSRDQFEFFDDQDNSIGHGTIQEINICELKL